MLWLLLTRIRLKVFCVQRTLNWRLGRGVMALLWVSSTDISPFKPFSCLIYWFLFRSAIMVVDNLMVSLLQSMLYPNASPLPKDASESMLMVELDAVLIFFGLLLWELSLSGLGDRRFGALLWVTFSIIFFHCHEIFAETFEFSMMDKLAWEKCLRYYRRSLDGACVFVGVSLWRILRGLVWRGLMEMEFWRSFRLMCLRRCLS